MELTTTAASKLLLAVFITGCASTPGHDGTQGEAGASVTGNGGAPAGSNSDALAGAAGAAEAGAAGEPANAGPIPLFNGLDFAGWDRYLGKPSDSEAALGIDNDPRAVYSIVMLDGEPAIRISGENWGSLISKREFCDFRLRAEYKWGNALWPPLNARDSGIMFLSTGPLGAVNAGGNALSDPIGSGGFMVSAEYQIAAGNVGSLYNLGPIGFSRIVANAVQDQPDSWNRVEISVQNDTASLRLNDQETARASGFLLEWPDQPTVALRCGKLQLQSEGAEIFFRRVEIEEFH